MSRLGKSFQNFDFSGKMSPEKRKICRVWREPAVFPAGVEIEKISAFQMKLLILFKHIQRTADHIDQLHGIDGPGDVPSGSAGDKLSPVQKMKVCFQHKILKSRNCLLFCII